MTTITNIAQRMLDENNYTTPSTTITEYLIKNAVDYINMECGTSIAFVPVAGAESLTASDAQIVTIKFVTTLMLRAYRDRGPNASLSGMGVAAVIADPQYAFYKDLIEKSMNRLRGRSFLRT